MRLNKLSELVHKSAKHSDCTSASVRVFFGDILDEETHPNNFTWVPGTRFTVSRTVYTKNSGSKYFIDNRESSYEEVCTLLKSKGIDLEHNRFLILQGEVEQISLMKPKSGNPNETGLLEYLEEIIGSH